MRIENKFTEKLINSTFLIAVAFTIISFPSTHARNIENISTQEKRELLKKWYKDIYLKNLPDLIRVDISKMEVKVLSRFLFSKKCLYINPIDQTSTNQRDEFANRLGPFESVAIFLNLKCMDTKKSQSYTVNFFKATIFQQKIHSKLIKFWIKNQKKERLKYATNFAVSKEFFGVFKDRGIGYFDRNITEILKEFWTLSLSKYIKRRVVVDSTLSELNHFFKLYFSSESRVDIRKSDPLLHKAYIQNLTRPMDAFWARYKLIKSAKKSVDATYFILGDDIFALSFFELLKLKAKELPVGSVRLMVDGRNETLHRKGAIGYLRDLQANGVIVKEFNPFFSTLGTSMIVGNHDKLLIIDRTKVIMGGRNIEDIYFLDEQERINVNNNSSFEGKKDNFIFRDNDIAVQFLKPNIPLQLSFSTEFHSKRCKDIFISKDYKNRPTSLEMKDALMAAEDRMNNLVLSDKTLRDHPEVVSYYNMFGIKDFKLFDDKRIVPIRVIDKTARFDKVDTIFDFLIGKINKLESGSDIVIKNPYIDFSPELFSALKNATERDVEITIFTNGPRSTDKRLVSGYFLHSFQNILDNLKGVKVFGTYDNVVIHQKTLILGDEVFMSTYNLDYLSKDINSEIGFHIEDSIFTESVRQEIYDEIEIQCKNYETLKKESESYPDKEQRKNRSRYKIYKMFRKYL